MTTVQWECMKPNCAGPVRPDPHTQFDTRYTTGRCKNHGKVVLVRLVRLGEPKPSSIHPSQENA
jgi:hypothetical protein